MTSQACWFCGGKQWVQAADVYRDCLRGADCEIDWELAATVPCPVCAVKR